MLNQVYAYKSFNEKKQFEGYLLFSNEKKTELFNQIINSDNEKNCTYEAIGWIEVGEFFYKKTQENHNFFTKSLF